MYTKITRRKAREDAVIILYQSDLLSKDVQEIIETDLLFEKKIEDFTERIVIGVSNNSALIDEKIKNVVENWKLERIAIVDRNIIRVAIYEMLFEDEIPLKVSVDEAIEIAKTLGEKNDTPKFVNGVLGKILTQIDDENKRNK